GLRENVRVPDGVAKVFVRRTFTGEGKIREQQMSLDGRGIRVHRPRREGRCPRQSFLHKFEASAGRVRQGAHVRTYPLAGDHLVVGLDGFLGGTLESKAKLWKRAADDGLGVLGVVDLRATVGACRL